MRKTLRVFVLIDGLGFGGAETLLSDFAEAAPSADLQLTVGYLREKDSNVAAKALRALGVEPRHVPIGGLLSLRSLRSVSSAIRDVAPDVVHTHLGYSDLLGGLAARRLRTPAVSTLHVMEWGVGLREATKSYLFARVRRHCMYRVIAVSAAARGYYVARAGGGDAEQIIAIPNGVVGNARPGAGATIRSQLGLAPDDIVIAMLSVLRPGKGHEAAIEAVRILHRTDDRVRLLIIGDGPARSAIATQADELGRAAVMAGHRDDVMAVLDAVDVLVHPSHADAFPTALLEAMAASVPVVATRVGGIPEIVDDGVTGFLIDAPPSPVELAAAIERVLIGDERSALGAAGRARFDAELSASRWVERTRAVYEAAIAARV